MTCVFCLLRFLLFSLRFRLCYFNFLSFPSQKVSQFPTKFERVFFFFFCSPVFCMKLFHVCLLACTCVFCLTFASSCGCEIGSSPREVENKIELKNLAIVPCNEYSASSRAIHRDTSHPLVVVEASPHTIGIEGPGGIMKSIIPRNSLLPTRHSQIFTTYQDNEAGISVNVYEGENPMTKDNRLLLRFALLGVPTAPRGVPQIELSFEIDDEAILHVVATDKTNHRGESIVVEEVREGILTNRQVEESATMIQ